MFNSKDFHSLVMMLMLGNTLIGLCLGIGVGYWIWG